MSLTTSLLKSNYTKRFYINTGNFFKPQFKTKLADSKNEIKAAQKLRYEVFFEDRKKKKIISISSFKRDTDIYDKYCDHIIVTYKKNKFSKTKVIGTYRLLKQENSKNVGFCTSEEYNLKNLLNSNRYNNLLEVSRSCIHKNHRNKNVLQSMWREIHNYVITNKIEGLFGTASFLHTNFKKIENELIYLQQNFLMEKHIEVTANPSMLIDLDYKRSIKPSFKLIKNLPTLIKGYLKLNAKVGNGAIIDPKFKTIDIFVFVEFDKIEPKYLEKFSY